MPVITRNVKLQFSSGGIEASNTTQTNGVDPDTTAVRAFKNPQVIGTSAEDVDLQDLTLTEEHIVLLTNKDATNYVDIYYRKDATPTDTHAGRIYPTEMWGPVRLPAQSGGYPKLRMVANTAACNVEVVACEAKPA
jgi:hypothetical protein